MTPLIKHCSLLCSQILQTLLQALKIKALLEIQSIKIEQYVINQFLLLPQLQLHYTNLLEPLSSTNCLTIYS